MEPAGGAATHGQLVRRIPLTAHRVIELVQPSRCPWCARCVAGRWPRLHLALAADFTVAADDAVFWEPFLARGFSPDSGDVAIATAGRRREGQTNAAAR
jgi:2-(1,2-epoxy-1,2-dihydrophenyl)acetyl-CoA isomerase